MRVRDGRREVHDFGPHRDLEPSMMKAPAGYGGDVQTGGWKDNAFLFDRQKLDRPPRSFDKAAYNRGHRNENIEQYRAKERARSARARERRRAASST